MRWGENSSGVKQWDSTDKYDRELFDELKALMPTINEENLNNIIS